MEELEITLNSWDSYNKKVKPSLVSFNLTNQHVIKLDTQYESPLKIILVNEKNSEDVSLRINVYDEKKYLFAGASYQLEKIRRIIKKDNLVKFRTNCQDGRSYIMWDAKFETRPLQPQSNPSLAINDSSAESPAIGESMPTSANTLPGDNIPITNTSDQRQIVVPKTLSDAIQYLVENVAQDTLVNNLRSEIERLVKVEEELKKKVQSLEGTLTEERQRAEKITADLEKMEKSFKEIKTQSQQRKNIIQLLKSATAASQPSMETGVYSLNDRVDQFVGKWRSLFDDLHCIFMEELDKQLLNPDSFALEQYRKLTYHPDSPTYSRHYSYVIIREMSSILCKFSRRVVLNDDGSFEYSEREDLVDNLMKHTMATSSRSDFAKRILDILVPPNDIDSVSGAVFKELPGGPKVFLENIFENSLKHLHRITAQYGLEAETMKPSLERITYEAIYITFQTTAIRDNFASFWSDVVWDIKLLNFPYEYKRLAPYMDEFNNSLETVKLRLGPEKTHVAFTVFPGCFYINTEGKIKVIERSQVVCCKRFIM